MSTRSTIIAAGLSSGCVALLTMGVVNYWHTPAAVQMPRPQVYEAKEMAFMAEDVSANGVPYVVFMMEDGTRKDLAVNWCAHPAIDRAANTVKIVKFDTGRATAEIGNIVVCRGK